MDRLSPKKAGSMCPIFFLAIITAIAPSKAEPRINHVPGTKKSLSELLRLKLMINAPIKVSAIPTIWRVLKRSLKNKKPNIITNTVPILLRKDTTAGLGTMWILEKNSVVDTTSINPNKIMVLCCLRVNNLIFLCFLRLMI